MKAVVLMASSLATANFSYFLLKLVADFSPLCGHDSDSYVNVRVRAGLQTFQKLRLSFPTLLLAVTQVRVRVRQSDLVATHGQREMGSQLSTDVLPVLFLNDRTRVYTHFNLLYGREKIKFRFRFSLKL